MNSYNSIAKNQTILLKMIRRPEQTCFQARHTMANRYVKSCSTSQIIKKVQVETTMKHLLLIHIRMAQYICVVHHIVYHKVTQCYITTISQ